MAKSENGKKTNYLGIDFGHGDLKNHGDTRDTDLPFKLCSGRWRCSLGAPKILEVMGKWGIFIGTQIFIMFKGGISYLSALSGVITFLKGCPSPYLGYGELHEEIVHYLTNLKLRNATMLGHEEVLDKMENVNDSMVLIGSGELGGYSLNSSSDTSRIFNIRKEIFDERCLKGQAFLRAIDESTRTFMADLDAQAEVLKHYGGCTIKAYDGNPAIDIYYPLLRSRPDAVVINEDGEHVGVIEVKHTDKTWPEIRAYKYQTITHMIVHRTSEGFLVLYQEKLPVQVIKIEQEDFAEFSSRYAGSMVAHSLNMDEGDPERRVFFKDGSAYWLSEKIDETGIRIYPPTIQKAMAAAAKPKAKLAAKILVPAKKRGRPPKKIEAFTEKEVGLLEAADLKNSTMIAKRPPQMTECDMD